MHINKVSFPSTELKSIRMTLNISRRMNEKNGNYTNTYRHTKIIFFYYEYFVNWDQNESRNQNGIKLVENKELLHFKAKAEQKRKW